MKKILLSLILLMSVLSVFAQDYYLLHKQQYECAFKYITEKRGGEKYVISHHIIDLDRWFFSGSLRDIPEKDSILQSYSRTHMVFADDLYSNMIVSMGKKTNNPDYVLFFSPIDNGMLTAQIVPFNRRIHKRRDIDCYDCLAFQNTVDAYLFVFSEEGNLIKVVSFKQIHFD